MQIIDFSQIYLAPIFIDSAAKSCAQNPSKESRDMMCHYAFNSIRAYNVANKAKYGNLVIACDNRSWRNDVFKYYKYLRKQNRAKDDSGIQWDFVNECSQYMKETLREYFPYIIIDVPGAEGDDIIGALAKHTSVGNSEENMFGESEPDPFLLISSDRDNFQLHKYSHLRQWSPQTKKLVKPDIKPHLALIEKIVKGDPGDGIASIKCVSEWFTLPDRGRAPAITKKYLQTFFDVKNPIDACLDDFERENYKRNEQLISYEFTPKEIYDQIIASYEEQKNKKHDKMRLMNFFVEHKMNVLFSKISDFY
jgi:hypothetical protein